MESHTPHDLALFVYGKITNIKNPPSVEVLEKLFQTLFLASLKSEEGVPIICSISYVNPRIPDPNPPKTIRDPRWEYIPLKSHANFNVHELSKIALSTDVNVSRLGVYTNKTNDLMIHGLFDQQRNDQRLMRFDQGGEWDPPGILQAKIVGIGHIVVESGKSLIAELNGGDLVEDTVNIFQVKKIGLTFLNGFTKCYTKVSSQAQDLGYPVNDDFRYHAFTHWIDIVQRILYRAKVYDHGGAILISNIDDLSVLRINYKIEYGRIPILFEKWLLADWLSDSLFLKLINTKKNDESIEDIDLYRNRNVIENDKADALRALNRAIDFIATLTRVDGLVLLDDKLQVKGFGCEIITKGDPNCKSYRTTSTDPKVKNSNRLEYEQYGTRHRSMLRYCSEDKNAVGFVISSDGPVRAMSKIGSRVFMWSNIQLSVSGLM